MLYEALLAYSHYLSIFLLVATLIVEWITFKPTLNRSEARLLQKTDSIYGLASILVLTTGLIRSFYFGKGSAYYWSNYIFLGKVGIFIIVGILSIWPTVLFIKWRKELEKGASEIILENNKARQIRRIIAAELLLVFSIPLLAALMARGFGFS